MATEPTERKRTWAARLWRGVVKADWSAPAPARAGDEASTEPLSAPPWIERWPKTAYFGFAIVFFLLIAVAVGELLWDAIAQNGFEGLAQQLLQLLR
ncbi:MAG: hypothetical protein AAFW46_17825, partial [Pseudomonadota bacterium]